MPEEPLKEFWAVTKTSLYHVKAPPTAPPIATKLASKGSSKVGVRKTIGNGMLAICQSLQWYVPEGGGLGTYEPNIAKVNTLYWGASTSPIVALFATLETAQACFEKNDLEPGDPRFWESTQEVLDLIGEEHPTVSICHLSHLKLSPHATTKSS